MRLAKLRKTDSEHTAQTAKYDIEKSSSIWTDFDPCLSISDCPVCSHFDSQFRARRLTKRQVRDQTKISQNQETDCIVAESRNQETDCIVTESRNQETDCIVTESRNQETDCIVTESDTSAHFDESADSVIAISGPSTSTPKKRYMLSRSLCELVDDHEKSADNSACVPSKTYADCATSPFKDTTFVLRPLKDVTLPLTKEEETYNTHLIRLKMKQSADKLTVTCKTGGQLLMFQKIVRPRKSSTVASSPVRGKRKLPVNKYQLDLSGGTHEDENKQHGTEIRKARKCIKMKLLEEAGYKKTVLLSSKKALAMRTPIGLSWTQHRKQSKFLRKIGMKFEGEKKQRQTQKDIQLAEIKTDKKRLRNGQGDKINTPLICIMNLPEFVTNLLDMYEENNRLT